MPRIGPLDPATAAGDTATHLATARKMLGGTPNLVTTTAHSSAALGALISLFGYAGRTSLGARTAEQIALAVAQRNRCGYCLSAHTALGKLHGLDDATLTAARSAASRDARTAALLGLAVDITEARGHIEDASLGAARDAGLTDAEIVEVVFLVAFNVFTNYMNSVAQTTIDFPVVLLGGLGEATAGQHGAAPTITA